MLLKNLINNTNYIHYFGPNNLKIEDITADSRNITKGSLFFCIKGEKQHGLEYIKDAEEKGAACFVLPYKVETKLPYIIVKEPKEYMKEICIKFFQNPSKDLDLFGITGTNGKTTTSYLCAAIFNTTGINSGIIGTTGVIYNSNFIKTRLTTPESVDLQRHIKNMVNSKIRACFLEVSSHGIAKDRVVDCDFKTAIFTNLSHDHLDFHKTMSSYFETKSRLFASLVGKHKYAVINKDDSYYSKLKKKVNVDIISYGIGNKADVTGVIVHNSNIHHNEFYIKYLNKEILINLKLPGIYNVYNALAAAAIALKENISLDTIKKGLESVERVPGRCEVLLSKNNSIIVIDYAHTPDALHNVLTTIKQFTSKRIITVFGCPGERDKEKRPKMGYIAEKESDLLILTSDNPGREEASDIIEDIKKGIKGNYLTYLDREEAVSYALNQAQDGDIILLAGKGHEEYQIVGDNYIPYSDREIVHRYGLLNDFK